MQLRAAAGVPPASTNERSGSSAVVDLVAALPRATSTCSARDAQARALALGRRSSARLLGHGEVGAEVEEVVLDVRRASRRTPSGSSSVRDDAEHGAELVDGAVRHDPRIVLRHAAAVAEARLAEIAAARVDPIELDHARSVRVAACETPAKPAGSRASARRTMVRWRSPRRSSSSTTSRRSRRSSRATCAATASTPSRPPTAPSAVEAALEHRPDLVVLDVMLPGFDGLQAMARMRQERHVPVILLTARGEESDRVVGLKLGADDYVVKPFSPAELVARVHAVLRRVGRDGDPADAEGADRVRRRRGRRRASAA